MAKINAKETRVTRVKINKSKSWFFEKINKVHKPLARVIKKQREKNHFNKIKNERKIRNVWYIYTMEYYSAIEKNTCESALMRWMKLEPIIQSEVSQKEKHQYSILTHIYGI